MIKAFYFLAMLPIAAMAPVDYGNLPILPNPVLTPGNWNGKDGIGVPTPLSILCKKGQAKANRSVDESLKKAVFKLYGINKNYYPQGTFEIDHLVSDELDGRNSIFNLWPQSYFTQPWNAHRKDVLENKLHNLMCYGNIHLSLAQAQYEISTDWIAAYKKYVLSGKY